MATSAIRNYDQEALFHAAQAEQFLAQAKHNQKYEGQAARAAIAQVHATLAVAYSNIGHQE